MVVDEPSLGTPGETFFGNCPLHLIIFRLATDRQILSEIYRDFSS